MTPLPVMTVGCERCGERLAADARYCGRCGAPLPDPSIGRIIAGRYRLVERVGAGSVGVVYRAEHTTQRRKLAIKLLPAESSRDPTTIERFRREGEVLVRLRSPHTITTYEFDRDADGTLYIAMELSPGRNLAEVLRTGGALDWPRALGILLGLCDSLGEAHALGVVHRDLKPENILLEDRAAQPDFVKVLDFGLAKVVPSTISLSPVGHTVSSVRYCSPEQLRREPVDARSDVYALGILGYLMVTGQHPFPDARSFGDMVDAHVQRVPPPPSAVHPGLPAEVDALLACCLDKDPKRRYPDTAVFAAAIQIALALPSARAGDTLRDER